MGKWLEYVLGILMAVLGFIGVSGINKMEKLDETGRELTVSLKALTVVQQEAASRTERIVAKIKEVERLTLDNERDIAVLKERVKEKDEKRRN
jgi:3-isopropylmalate dehydratase small subunit